MPAVLALGSLVLACAPFISADTMQAIVEVESKGNPWAIGTNGGHRVNRANSYEEAVKEAKRLIALGANIDMGLMQVNVITMRDLGLTVERIFDPCTNLYAGGTVLYRFFIRALSRYAPGDQQKALIAAVSAYNTGSFTSGVSNGYVGKVQYAAGALR